jgi:hypothetical protein
MEGQVVDSITSILLAFSVQWSHPDYPPVKVNQSELNAAEIALGVHFPEDYKAEILSVGLPHPTLALLSAIVDQEIDLYDLSELSAPNAIVDETTVWRKIGLPKNFIVIGNDSMGNKFCFDGANLQDDTVASAAVYFWDQETGTVDLVAASFPDWIGDYVGEWSAGLNFKDF